MHSHRSQYIHLLSVLRGRRATLSGAFTTVLLPPGRSRRAVDRTWNGSWTQSFRYPASPADLGLAQPWRLLLRSIIAHTSSVHLASDIASASKSQSPRFLFPSRGLFLPSMWSNGCGLSPCMAAAVRGRTGPPSLFSHIEKSLVESSGGCRFKNGTRNGKCHCLTSSVPQFCSVFYCLFSGIFSALGFSQLSELNERKWRTCKGHILRNESISRFLNSKHLTVPCDE